MDADDAEPGRTGWLRQLASWLASVVAVLVIVQAVGWLRAPALPEVAPPLTLPDLQGESVSLEELRGRTVVLNFWATWCGPCRLEAPWFSSFAAAHPDVAVLGVAADGPASRLRKAADDLGITYPVLQGDAEALAAYGVTTFPTTVIIGPDGTVRHAHVGLLTRPQLAWLTGRWW